MGRGRAPCCEKVGLKKGPWTPIEDMELMSYIQKHGHGNWRALPKQAGLLRCGKSCRLRWINYLRPDIKRGNFTLEEEKTIIKLHDLLGNKWSAIASRLPGRTDNEIKNVWNTHLKKRLKSKGTKSSPNESQESPSSSNASQISYTNSEDHQPNQELLHSLGSQDSCMSQNEHDGHTEQIQFEDMLQILNEPPVDLFDILDDSSSFMTSSTASQDGSTVDNGSNYHNMPVDDETNDKLWYRYLEKELELWPEDQKHQGPVAGDADIQSLVDGMLHSNSSDGLFSASYDPISLYFETWPSSPPPTFYL